MKLLFATSLLPDNEAVSGYEIANRALLSGLRSLGHDVVPIGFANIGKSSFVAAGAMTIGELSVSNGDANLLQKLRWLKAAVQNQTTFAGAKLQIISRRGFDAMVANAGAIDGVIINGAPMAAAFEKSLTTLPYIYIAHNVEWLTAAQNAKSAKGFIEKLLFVREARKLKALETRLAANACHVLTLTEEDQTTFKAMGARSVSPVPLIVNLEASKPIERAPKWDAGLIGTWSWAPNRAGLDWFLSEVTPHLPNEFKFAIAGKLPGDVKLKHPGATALGFVPSATDFVRNCACLPLTSQAGTGVQLKTLEAFELGLPTVATPFSIRGVTQVPRNCDVREDPKQFAEALVKAARMGQNADIDGRSFHRKQLAGLMSSLVSALDHFRSDARLEAAE